jgi:hypothetical protein
MVSVPVINTIGIRLTDDRNRSIDLNGHHFQLSLKIAYIHKEKLREKPPRRYEPIFTETLQMKRMREKKETADKLKLRENTTKKK